MAFEMNRGTIWDECPFIVFYFNVHLKLGHLQASYESPPPSWSCTSDVGGDDVAMGEEGFTHIAHIIWTYDTAFYGVWSLVRPLVQCCPYWLATVAGTSSYQFILQDQFI